MSNTDSPRQDGVHAMVPRDEMCLSACKLRDTYAVKPDTPFYQKTFGLWMCLETWYANGLDRDTDLDELFMFDEPGFLPLHQLGWCESAFDPVFEQTVIEDRGECELVRDRAGRHVLYFKGKRQGFMPEYVDHPVSDRAVPPGGMLTTNLEEEMEQP